MGCYGLLWVVMVCYELLWSVTSYYGLLWVVMSEQWASNVRVMVVLWVSHVDGCLHHPMPSSTLATTSVHQREDVESSQRPTEPNTAITVPSALL